MLKYIPAWLPGASFKSKAAIWRNISLQLVNGPFDVVKRRMVSRFILVETASTYMNSILVGWKP